MQTEELQLKECHENSSDKKQIYIVDDDESVRRALGTLLDAFGFQVRTFSSAEEFFSAVPNSIPGCLILDVHLSGLSGWDAQQRLINKGSQRPVIIITAATNDGLKQKALKEGAVGFLQKPFNNQELIDLINQAYSN